jgi:hypothetical protein
MIHEQLETVIAASARAAREDTGVSRAATFR